MLVIAVVPEPQALPEPLRPAAVRVQFKVFRAFRRHALRQGRKACLAHSLAAVCGVDAEID